MIFLLVKRTMEMWKFVVIWCGILIANCNGFLSFALNEAMKNYLYQINVAETDVYGSFGQYGHSNFFYGENLPVKSECSTDTYVNV